MPETSTEAKNYLDAIVSKEIKDGNTPVEIGVNFDHVINTTGDNHTLKQFYDDYSSFMKEDSVGFVYTGQNAPTNPKTCIWLKPFTTE